MSDHANLLLSHRDIIGEAKYLDSGSYRLGQLTARFIIKATARDRDGRLIAFNRKTLRAITDALLEPLASAAGNSEQSYAVGGKVMETNLVNGTSHFVPRGVWKLSTESTPGILHDEH